MKVKPKKIVIYLLSGFLIWSFLLIHTVREAKFKESCFKVFKKKCDKNNWLIYTEFGNVYFIFPIEREVKIRGIISYSKYNHKFIGDYTKGYLCIMDLNGNIKKLYKDILLRPSHCEISPDGKKILFLGKVKKSEGLFLFDFENEKLFKISEFCKLFSFLGNEKVTYVKNGNRVFIYNLEVKTTKQIPLKLKVTSKLSGSPDGRYLIFQNKSSKIYLYNLAENRFYPILDGKILTNLRWSPDSNYLVYVKVSEFFDLTPNEIAAEPKDILIYSIKDKISFKIGRIYKPFPDWDYVFVKDKILKKYLLKNGN